MGRGALQSYIFHPTRRNLLLSGKLPDFNMKTRQALHVVNEKCQTVKENACMTYISRGQSELLWFLSKLDLLSKLILFSLAFYSVFFLLQLTCCLFNKPVVGCFYAVISLQVS